MSNNINDLKTRIQELDEEYKKIPRRKWRFRIAAFLFILFSLLLMIIISNRRDNAYEKIRAEYLSENDKEELKDIYDEEALRGNPDALGWFESNMLGILNNNALAGQSWHCEGNKNYRNQIGELVAYQDEQTKTLIVEVSGQRVHTGEHKIGEIIATNGKVYYIDEDEGNKLCVYDVETSKVTELETDVKQFAIYGEYIFFLGEDETIYRYSEKTHQKSEVVNNVQRFYLSGSIIAQNDNKIIQAALDGSSYTELIQDALLIGADEGHIYFTNFGVVPNELIDKLTEESPDGLPVVTKPEVDLNQEYIVCALDLSSKEITIIDSRNSLVRAVYLTNEGILVDTVE